MKDASGVDDDGLAGHGLGAAHGDMSAQSSLSAGFFTSEARRRAFDLLGPEVGCRVRAVQETGATQSTSVPRGP